MKQPRVIAIASQKGGVAKTTTCHALGASLAELGYSVLLIDLDPQGHLTLSLGLDPNKLRWTVMEALLSNSSLIGITRETETPFLDVAPANQELGLMNSLLYKQTDFESVLRRQLRANRNSYYDVVIIDSPPALNALMLNALSAADLLIIPTQCEYYASHSLQHVLRMVKWVRRKTNPTLAYRILVTMFDRRNRISHLVRAKLEKSYSHAMFDTVIEVDTKLRESPVMGQPITLYAPQTRGANQYRALAQELMSDERRTDKQAA